MQDVLKKFGSKELIEIIFDTLLKRSESKDLLYRLMTNKYANYFVQLFVTKSEDTQKSEMIQMVMGDYMQVNQVFVKCSVNSIGTHCIQAFIDQMKS